MSGPMISAFVARIDARLATLQMLLDTAASQWRAAGEDPEALVSARLADDMAPLATQIVFACHQPTGFIDWATGTSTVDAEPKSLADMAAVIAATRAQIAAFQGSDALLATTKHIALPGNMGLTLDGDAYINDWIWPNFYFHFVTAYDILRQQGVEIGKANYMAHLMPLVRPVGAAA
jgi:uncharacterized protein